MPNEEAQNGDRAATPQVRETFGGRLASGLVLDVVRPKAELELVGYDTNGNVSIAPYFDANGVRYTPPCVDRSISEAIYFPQAVAEYPSGVELFREIAAVRQEYCGLSAAQAAVATTFDFNSWLADCLPMKPRLCVTAINARQAQPFSQISRALCRRALVVAELTRQLPFQLAPTLIVNDRKALLRSAAEFWGAADYAGTFIPGPRGTLRHVACSKVVLIPPYYMAPEWLMDSMQLMLPCEQVPRPSDRVLAELADRFQPKLELFRLRWLSARANGEGDGNGIPPRLATSPLAQAVFAGIPNDPEIVKLLTPAIEQSDQEALEQQLRDPRVAIVQVAWAPAHQRGEMSVGEITRRVNAQLRKNGEFLEYDWWEIGKLLKRMQLLVRRNRNYSALKFCADLRQRVHALARQFRLSLPAVAGCPHCAELVDRRGTV